MTARGKPLTIAYIYIVRKQYFGYVLTLEGFVYPAQQPRSQGLSSSCQTRLAGRREPLGTRLPAQVFRQYFQQFNGNLFQHPAKDYFNTMSKNEILIVLRNQIYFNLQLYDPNTKRYEVPVPMPQATTKASSPKYKVEFKEDPFSLKILRKDNGAVL